MAREGERRARGEGLHVFNRGGGLDGVGALLLNAESEFEPFASGVTVALFNFARKDCQDVVEESVEQVGLTAQRVHAMGWVHQRARELLARGFCFVYVECVISHTGL